MAVFESIRLSFDTVTDILRANWPDQFDKRRGEAEESILRNFASGVPTTSDLFAAIGVITNQKKYLEQGNEGHYTLEQLSAILEFIKEKLSAKEGDIANGIREIYADPLIQDKTELTVNIIPRLIHDIQSGGWGDGKVLYTDVIRILTTLNLAYSQTRSDDLRKSILALNGVRSYLEIYKREVENRVDIDFEQEDLFHYLLEPTKVTVIPILPHDVKDGFVPYPASVAGQLADKLKILGVTDQNISEMFQSANSYFADANNDLVPFHYQVLANGQKIEIAFISSRLPADIARSELYNDKSALQKHLVDLVTNLINMRFEDSEVNTLIVPTIGGTAYSAFFNNYNEYKDLFENALREAIKSSDKSKSLIQSVKWIIPE